MDQLTAHLDRGWDLAQHGDARGAEASARQALEIDPNAPEVHNLLGYISAMNGEPDEAIEHYRQALALDEGYFDAMLNAAEVMVHPLQQWDDAIEMCDEAISWAESDEELCDALLIKIDALLGKGDDDGARKALRAMPKGPFESERYDFLVGRAHFEVGNVVEAGELIERAIARDARHAEAHYYRALIREAKGDSAGATSSYLQVRLLDEALPPAPWSIPTEAFRNLVMAAVKKLDPALRRFVEAAEIFVVPLPGLEVIADGIDPRAPLLIDGLATPERPGPPCARLFVYQRNVERVVASSVELQDEVTATLEAEITATFLEDRRSGMPRGKHELN
jgi:tetratricopeptide (TPR) repeat protein